jgi:hypothetical protein
MEPAPELVPGKRVAEAFCGITVFSAGGFLMIRRVSAGFVIFFCSAMAQSPQTGLDELIQKIDARTKSYKPYHEFTASAASVYSEMDENWKPEKTTTVLKQINQRDSSRTETIVKAVENAKGKETDITVKLREEAGKQEERARKAKRPKSGKDGQQQSMTVGFKELYPFSAEDRVNFTFTLKPDTVIDGNRLLRIQSRLKDRKSRRYEGEYSVDAGTFDILRLEGAPARNPKFVKEMRLVMSFKMLPGDVWMFKSFWMRMYASIVIKKIRLEIDESYDDFKILR